jgi:hypothetical protein
MRTNTIIATLAGAAIALAAFGGTAAAQTPAPPATPGVPDISPAAPSTPSGPLIRIKNCTVKQSRNAGGFVYASCSIVTTNLQSADGPAVKFRSNLKPFNPGTPGPWRKQSGNLGLGSVTTIKFAYKRKSLSQVRKQLKVTLSGATDGTITSGTAVAAS